MLQPRSQDWRQTMTESPSAEPHLDEILASIRRIISEDGPAAAAAPIAYGPGHAGAEASDDVLVLTRRAPVQSQWEPRAEAHEEPATPDVAADADFAIDPTLAPALEAPPEPQSAAPWPEAHPMPAPEPEHMNDEERVVAPQTEAKAAAAFDKLSAVARESEATPASPPLTISAPGRTLEDVVRELMRPMIKEWLDENLPAIVQGRVDQEIDRITRLRVR